MIKYNGSIEQLKNFKKASIIGNKKIQENKQKRIEEYNKDPNFCKQCNNKFLYNERHKTFCNASCAASFNNLKRILSNATKEKISKSLGGRGKKYKKEYKKNCIGCKKEYKTRIKNQKYCSRLCVRKYASKQPEAREKNRQAQLKLVKEGKHIGWKSRTKKPSYPEQYFIDLFNNENINGWKREYKVGAYFIDFAFEKKMIALEIDGKQHWENLDRIERDKRKDKILKEQGWKIFRIKWFNPVNENNKKKLYTKINEFKKIIMSL